MNVYKKWILLSYFSIATASAAVITPALPTIQKNLGIDHSAINWIISIYLIGYTLGQFFYSPLANRLGRIGALQLGMKICIFGCLVCTASAMLGSYYGLLVGRLITALGASSGLSCTFMLINETLSHNEAKYLLSFTAPVFTIAVGCAVLLGGLVTHYIGWQYCFFLSLAHSLLMLLLTNLFEETLKTPKKSNLAHIFKSYLEALTHRRLFVFSTCVALVTIYQYCFTTAAPFITQHLFNLDAARYGTWNLINTCSMCCGGLVVSRLTQKYDGVRILKTAICFMIIALLVMLVLGFNENLNKLNFFMLSASTYFFASWIFPTASHIASNAIECKANAAGAMNFINVGTTFILISVMGYLPFMILWSFISLVLVSAILCLLGVMIFSAEN